MVPRPLAVCALLACLGLLTAIGPGAAATAPAAPSAEDGARAAYEAPLTVEIDTMNPAHLPPRGDITVTGTVTNVDDVAWDEIKLYPFFGAGAPMTTRDQLAEASGSNPLLEVGGRITAVDAAVDELAPDDTASFTLSVPRSLLETAGAGVYWFGVHAMGQSEEQSRDLVADGRARTWLPYVPRGRRDPERVAGRIKTAMVVPLRRYLPYASDGSLDRVAQWRRALDPDGRLRSIVDFGAGAGEHPMTWLVDPALVDVVSRLGRGNPPRSIAPTEPVDDEEPPGDEQSPGDGESPTADSAASEGAQSSEEADGLSPVARGWLAVSQRVLEDDEVLSLPYGDLDVEAAARLDHDLYELARERPGAVLASWDVNPRPALGSPGNFLDPDVFELLAGDHESAVLATDEMFGDDPPGVADVDGHKVGVVSSGVLEGGTAPGDRYSSLQLRQRLLGEAAIRMLSDNRHPLIAVMPRQWDGEDPGPFFDGLTGVGWLDLTTYADATSRDGRSVKASALEYPERLRDAQVDAVRFDDATELITAGESLQALVTRNDEVAAEVTNQALAAPSYGARFAPRHAARSVVESRERIAARMRSVGIEAGPGVTLSSRDGGFAAVVSNSLEQAVTVRIEARTQDGVEITQPEPVELPAEGRTTVVLNAHAKSVGVHKVTLVLTDLDGSPIGSSDVVSIRSSQVSGVIWLIIGAGCGLLLIAIAIRLVRRIRRSRRGDGPAAAAAEATDHEQPRPVETS